MELLANLIHHDAAVCGGKPVIGGTRIGVYDIVSAVRRHQGHLERVLTDYPDLTLDQIQAALTYYVLNPGEIEDILEERKAFYEAGLRAQQPGTVAHS